MLKVDAMSAQGQARHFDHAPITSGLPRQAEKFRAGRHFAFVPTSESRDYSITSSARPSSESGTVRPSALAVLRLNRSPALKFRSLAAINDSIHVKHFTFFHYRPSVEQNSFATAD